MTENICIIGSDTLFTEGLSIYLLNNGFATTTISNISSALSFLSRDNTSLIIIDTMSPGHEEEEFCRQVHGLFGIPILLLARNYSDEEYNNLLRFEADMYETKIFSYALLAARVKTMLRWDKIKQRKSDSRNSESPDCRYNKNDTEKESIDIFNEAAKRQY